jgi:hypothetical protein
MDFNEEEDYKLGLHNLLNETGYRGSSDIYPAENQEEDLEEKDQWLPAVNEREDLSIHE